MSTNILENIYTKELTIVTADVLQLNTTPKIIVEAPGVGYALELISWSTSITYITTAYATHTNIIIITDTATNYQGLDGAILLSTINRKNNGSIYFSLPGTTDTKIIENKALTVSILTGNPTAGDSDIKINIAYRIIKA